MNKKEIETILKINGFDNSTPEDQIKTVLLSARYSADEVDAAIIMLKRSPDTGAETVSGLHKVFYADKRLRPSEISSLLGVDLDLETPISRRSRRSTLSILQFILVWFFSVFFAVSGILFYMYLNEIGLFHPSSIKFF